jgi:cytochrome P450
VRNRVAAVDRKIFQKRGIDLADNSHPGFGRGPHYCVDAPLGRLGAETALVALGIDLSIRAS